MSFGPTYYIMLSLFIFFTLLALLVLFIGKRIHNLSEKNKARLNKLEDILFFNPVIRLTFLSAIKVNIAALLVFKLLADEPDQVIAASAMFGILTVIPLIYSRVLCKYGKRLHEEQVKRKILNLYDNKNIERGRNHRLWVFPLCFFYRRTVFALLTIYMFEKPNMQMIVHQFMSLLTIVYLARDQQRFLNKAIRLVEIGTEMLLLVTCAFVQQLILPLEEEQSADITFFVFSCVGVLCLFNAVFVVRGVRQNCRDKKRSKAREQRRVVWNEAW